MKINYNEMKQITNCKRCDISLNRNNIVNGVGNTSEGSMVLIGEAPGYMEDKLGLPFVGNSGKLLNTMLNLIGLHRNDVYITNIIKCRPLNNRNPLATEISNCNSYLHNEMKVIKPKIVVLLGGVALNTFFGVSNLTVTKCKGYVIPYKGYRVMTVYHPSYVLRNNHNKGLLQGYVSNFRTIGLIYRYSINPLITTKI